MRLLRQIKRRSRERDLDHAQAKLQGKPSPFREGAPEKAQSAAGGTAETRFIP